MKVPVDQVRDSVNCRVDEVRYFVKIVDIVRVDQVRVDQVGCSQNNDTMLQTYKYEDTKVLKPDPSKLVFFTCGS